MDRDERSGSREQKLDFDGADDKTYGRLREVADGLGDRGQSSSFDDQSPSEPTLDQLVSYRASALEAAAAQVERGDGSARSNMMLQVSESKKQGLLDSALKKLEEEGKASIVRDKDGVATEIVIDPATGPYDRGVKTIVQLEGQVKVDGRNERQAADEKREAALRAANASVDTSFLRHGERPLTHEEKEITKNIHRAMINGDGEKLSSLAKDLLNRPMSSDRVISEIEKTVYPCISIEKGADGRDQLRILAGSQPLIVNRDGEIGSETYAGISHSKEGVAKSLKAVSDWSIYRVNDLYDNSNEFNSDRAGAVTTPEERARYFNNGVQALIAGGN